MGNNKRKKYEDFMSKKAKEIVDGLDKLYSTVPNPDWLTK
jgi:hypothetical protein|nr:MAG TPA: hypothetical protein [Crassvirales sp.]